MPAMTLGTDFKGKTSSAEARPPLAGRVGRVFSRILEVTSSTVISVSASSREMVIGRYLDLFGQNTLPKYPVRMKY